MTSLMGYADKMSVAPGDKIEFKVSCEGAPTFHAEIRRIISPEVGPIGPPFRFEKVATATNGDYPARVQPLRAGSCVVVPPHKLVSGLKSFTVQAMIWPTTPGRGRQAILGTWNEAEGTGFGLALDAAGALEVRLGRGRGPVAVLGTGVTLFTRKWYFVAASYDHASGTLSLYQELLADKTMAHAPPIRVTTQASDGFVPGTGPFLFAAWHVSGECPVVTGGHFNGKIDRPRLASVALGRDGMAQIASDAMPSGRVTDIVGAWDFSLDIPTDLVRDTSGNRLDGLAVNMPARAMTGFNWDGSEMNWRNAPGQYGAIHFHDDDMADAGWSTDFTFVVPDGLRSGCYAAWLTAGEARFQVAFFVRPRKGRPTADVVYLASSATYTVYCNNAGRFRSPMTEMYQGRLTVMDAVDILLLQNPGLGYSTYDRHSDGSGIAYSSRLRPATNIRPTGRLWNYCCDLLIVDWLERSGIAYDVVTDDDIHEHGLDLIRPYRVMVTGSHPEYASLETMDALDAWARRGGRFMYLGGNGFYWRVAYHPSRPGIIEVRRSEDGTRAWDAEVGEYYHSFTGEYGGLWRRQGRAPQALAGVGFISQGFDRSEPYHRLPAASDPRAAFIFEGVEGDVLGDFGLLQGGAAGIEIDCVDPALGTPPHALVVARSKDHSNTYELVNEEVRVAHGMTDGLLNPLIRADMTFFETPNGGAVFSTGSIAYAGALGHDDFKNPIAQLTWNVLRRFADPTPFVLPAP